MSAEVQQLLDVVQRKSAALALAESRLSARLRWGVAVMQAKREAAVLRQAFMWWRCVGLRELRAAGQGRAKMECWLGI